MLVEHLIRVTSLHHFAEFMHLAPKLVPKSGSILIFSWKLSLFFHTLRRPIHFTPGRHGRGRHREIWIDLIIEKKCERKQDFLVLRWRWTTWCISQRSEFVSTWCGWQGQRPDIYIRKGHVNYNLEIINDPRVTNCDIQSIVKTSQSVTVVTVTDDTIGDGSN